ncbi:MAG TPA: hypothetical protein VIK74_11065, partial [Parasegetibacter sp.]
MLAIVQLLALASYAQGQPASNLRKKLIPASPSIQIIDTLSIVPKTFSIAGVPPESYKIDEAAATLYWLRQPNEDSVWISYRIFPFHLKPVLNRFNYDSIQNNFLGNPFVFNGNKQQEEGGIF